MKKWFGSSSSYDDVVDRATSSSNIAEDWQAFMNISDKISRGSDKDSQDALRSIGRRLSDRNPFVQLQAASLLNACIENSSKAFRLAVCSRSFMDLLISTLTSKSANAKVSARIKGYMLGWAKTFGSDPQLDIVRGTIKELKGQGIDFDNVEDNTSPAFKRPVETRTPSTRTAELLEQEEEDIRRAIQESLKQSSATTTSSSNNQTTGEQLYDTYSNRMVKSKVIKTVKVMHPFEAKEANELELKEGMLISVLDDSDMHWWSGEAPDGNQGFFPASFVTDDLSYEKPEEVVQEEEPKEEEPEPVTIDVSLLDKLLMLLMDAKPGDDPHSEEQQLILSLEANAALMAPLIQQETAVLDEQYGKLWNIDDTYNQSLALYEQLMKAPAPQKYAPQPQPQQQYYNQSQPGYAQPQYQQHPPHQPMQAPPRQIPQQQQYQHSPQQNPGFAPPSFQAPPHQAQQPQHPQHLQQVQQPQQPQQFYGQPPQSYQQHPPY